MYSARSSGRDALARRNAATSCVVVGRSCSRSRASERSLELNVPVLHPGSFEVAANLVFVDSRHPKQHADVGYTKADNVGGNPAPRISAEKQDDDPRESREGDRDLAKCEKYVCLIQ